ncbi:hypothetical protein TCAL_10882 [Tigriopus californicus]|uniref:t-SNARE coiled-coil homology domain-containing protein n=1 Tax=Tigriopus californicus TaxID=6832 RepID=A0A553NFB5_TIGCA|nr:BET1 homolog [Tigriopus californicus]TRY64121.1 hypothetical protein TCAL_10882 [Tigriopus californicus]|eukprot:TCALIF_10882-PA protein Name:"Similar to BET1 BET1 homolog (Homo sapiens)" AED:0.44 eAED:0.44 QI:0/-1/0/1/-1/1/1/0/110
MYRSHRAHPANGSSRNFAGHESLEDDNALREDELKGKVTALKSLSIDIGTEVREHNRYLRDVDDTFDSTSGLLGKSINNVLKLARSGSRYHLLYLFLFCLFVFFVLWLRL